MQTGKSSSGSVTQQPVVARRSMRWRTERTEPWYVSDARRRRDDKARALRARVQRLVQAVQHCIACLARRGGRLDVRAGLLGRPLQRQRVEGGGHHRAPLVVGVAAGAPAHKLLDFHGDAVDLGCGRVVDRDADAKRLAAREARVVGHRAECDCAVGDAAERVDGHRVRRGKIRHRLGREGRGRDEERSLCADVKLVPLAAVEPCLDAVRYLAASAAASRVHRARKA
mmetsp:Transcript_12899/g.41834  ORF Transcript_12899/g.41834 Transcript_12899/m.41834 type:complete len:227 (+) Transcript_12899:345-1025(+)